jgi:peptidoglycan/LPS O-acetylase OafA/YrhL
MAAPADAPRHYSTFDALRIIAAIAVILSHAYPLTGHRKPFTMHLGGYTPDLGPHSSCAEKAMPVPAARVVGCSRCVCG